MRGPLAMGLGLGVVIACSDDDKTKTQADCDAIANDIRAAAQQRNVSPQGICNNTTPEVQKAFANACAALTDCNAHCCK